VRVELQAVANQIELMHALVADVAEAEVPAVVVAEPVEVAERRLGARADPAVPIQFLAAARCGDTDITLPAAHAVCRNPRRVAAVESERDESDVGRDDDMIFSS
jgi:hypothetical protein